MSLLKTLTGAVNSGLKAAADGRTNDFQLANMSKKIEDEKSFAALDRAEMVSQEYMTKLNQQWNKYETGVADGSVQPDVDYEKKYQASTDLMQADGYLTPGNVFSLFGKEAALDFANRTVMPDILGPGKRLDETNSQIVDTNLGPAIDMQVRTTKIGEDGGVTAYSSNLTEGGQSVADLDKQGGADAVNANTLPPLTTEALDQAYFSALNPEFKTKIADLYSRTPGASSTMRRMGLSNITIDNIDLPSQRKAAESVIRQDIAALGPQYKAAVDAYESKLAANQNTANYVNTAQTSLAMAQQAAADGTGTDMSAPAPLQKFDKDGKLIGTTDTTTTDTTTTDTTTTDTTEVPALTPGTGFREDANDPNSPLLFGQELKSEIFRPAKKYDARMNKYSDPKTLPGELTLEQWASVDSATRDKAIETRRQTNTRVLNNLWNVKRDDSGEAVISPRAKLAQELKRYKGLNLTPTDRRGQSIEQFESTIKEVEGFYKNMGSVKNKEKFLTYLQQNPDELKAWQDSPFDYGEANMNNTNKFLGKPVPTAVNDAVDPTDIDLTNAVEKANNATAGVSNITTTSLFNSIKNSVPGFVDAKTVQALKDTADNLKTLTAEKENELVKFLEQGGDMRRMRADNQLALLAAISSTFPKDDPRSAYMFSAFAQAAPLLAETGMYSTAGEELRLSIERGERANTQLDINLQTLELNLEKNNLQIQQFNQNTQQDLIDNNQWERNHLLEVKKHEDGQKELINTVKINPFANRGHLDAKETGYYDLIINPNSDTNSDLTSAQKVDMARPYFSALSTAMNSLPSKTWGSNETASYNLLKKDFDLGANVLLQDLYQNNKSAWTNFVEAIPFVEDSAVPKAVMETVFSMAALDEKGNFTTDPNKIDEYVPVDSATGRQNYPEGISAAEARSVFGSVLGQGYFNSIALANSKRALHSKKD